MGDGNPPPEWGFFTDESGQQIVKPNVIAGKVEKLT